MKRFFLAFLLFYLTNLKAQVAITAVTTSTASSTPSSYTNGADTYNWGTGNSTLLTGFTAGGLSYSYSTSLNGSVKLRRVNNAGTTGVFSLVWAEVTGALPTLNMLPTYENNMELFFDAQTYNKGTDNLFDNTSGNSNNIERLDWILPSAYISSTPSQLGFAVFERGGAGTHDPFCIAAITSVDVSGNPASYGNIVRVASTGFGDPGPSLNYQILKAQFPSNLLDAGANTQGRGGVIISFQSLGITSSTPIYGYSLFSNDLPGGATPADLVNFNNPTFFPTNTTSALGNGGIDLLAITGIYVENSILPVKFITFSGVENNNLVTLKWLVENEALLHRYDIERSTDGVNFTKIKEVNKNSSSSYNTVDDISAISNDQVWYRINQYDIDGSHYYSKIIVINRKKTSSTILVFPNPVTTDLFISISSITNNKATISLYNTAGARVFEQKASLLKGNNSISLDGINKLAQGIYQLVLKKDDGTVLTKKIIKQ